MRKDIRENKGYSVDTMLRYGRRGQSREEDGDINTTPLRGSIIRPPRLRLWEKDGRLEAANWSNVSCDRQTSKPTIQRTGGNTYPSDRFISCRRNYSVDAANYLLRRKNEGVDKNKQLDVFKQIDSIVFGWREKLMRQLMAKENIIPGVRQKGILRSNQLSSHKLPGNLVGYPMDLWDGELLEEGLWKSKPRKRPLIGIMDCVLDMPGFEAMPRARFRLIDWSSKNVIAAAIDDTITFYDTKSSYLPDLQSLGNISTCILKWSNDGNKLAICTTTSMVTMYDLEVQKFVWSTECKCVSTCNVHCFIRCVCWSRNDQHLVTGCRGLISVYLAAAGQRIRTVLVHPAEILALAFSPNYRYLVSTAQDTNVRIFFWPSFMQCLDITYYVSVKAVAWHPHENGVLCIGGGLRDASLSLWNVNRLDPISYRRVNFYGCVENLAWNKHSGELVVHWSYWEDRKRFTMVPVMASIDRVVDTVPVEKDSRVCFVMWNSDHTQLGFKQLDRFFIDAKKLSLKSSARQRSNFVLLYRLQEKLDRHRGDSDDNVFTFSLVLS